MQRTFIDIDIIVEEGGFLPEYKTELAAGADLFVPKGGWVIPVGRSVMPLFLRIGMPADIEAQVRPRSGNSVKGIEGYADMPHIGKAKYKKRYENIEVVLGTIDADYRGVIGVIFHNKEEFPVFVEEGMGVAQLVFNETVAAAFNIRKTLPDSERGDGGFGHTG